MLSAGLVQAVPSLTNSLPKMCLKRLWWNNNRPTFFKYQKWDKVFLFVTKECYMTQSLIMRSLMRALLKGPLILYSTLLYFWNTLPEDMQIIVNIHQFKTRLTSELRQGKLNFPEYKKVLNERDRLKCCSNILFLLGRNCHCSCPGRYYTS